MSYTKRIQVGMTDEMTTALGSMVDNIGASRESIVRGAVAEMLAKDRIRNNPRTSDADLVVIGAAERLLVAERRHGEGR